MAEIQPLFFKKKHIMAKAHTQQYAAFLLKYSQVVAGFKKLEGWKKRNEFNQMLAQALFNLLSVRSLLSHTLFNNFDANFQPLPFRDYFYSSVVEKEDQRFVFLTNDNTQYKKVTDVTKKEGILAIIEWLNDTLKEFQDISIEPDNDHLKPLASSIEIHLILCKEYLNEVIKEIEQQEKADLETTIKESE